MEGKLKWTVDRLKLEGKEKNYNKIKKIWGGVYMLKSKGKKNKNKK